MWNLVVLGFLLTCYYANAEYYGKPIGDLEELVDPEIHGVTGKVYAVNERTLYIDDFTYYGGSDDVFFYATRFDIPDERGFKVQDWDNDGYPLRKYNKEGVAISLPGGITLNDIRMFYVWNEKLQVSLGHIKIPRNFDYPKPKKLGALKGVHAISSGDIIILDMQTLLIPYFYYHGEVVQSKFWISARQSRYAIDGETSVGLTPDGIQIPDENGSDAPLTSYYGKTIILTLPGDLTVQDIGAFGVWDEKFATSYASIEIPDMINLPPSRRMLKISSKPVTRLQDTENPTLSSYASDNKIKSQNQNQLDLPNFLIPPKVIKNSEKKIDDDLTSDDKIKLQNQDQLDLPNFLIPPKVTKIAERKTDDNTSDDKIKSQNQDQPNFFIPPKVDDERKIDDDYDYDYKINDKRDTKANTLTKINGKWYYLIPADDQ